MPQISRNEGVSPETIIKTGSPMREVLEHHADAINQSNIISKEHLNPGEYFIVSTHREENVDSEINFKKSLDTLSEIEKHIINLLLF